MAPNNPNTDKNQQAEELEFSDEPVLGEEEAHQAFGLNLSDAEFMQ